MPNRFEISRTLSKRCWKLTGRNLEASEVSLDLLWTGTTENNSQQSGNEEARSRKV